jgi:hypothetical protein
MQNACLFTGNINVYTSHLAHEAENCAVLDSACSKTVCGRDWMKRYIENLPEVKKKEVIKVNSTEPKPSSLEEERY